MDRKISLCRGCGKAIRWVRTERGKNMPLDAEPVKDVGKGVFVLDGDTAHPWNPLLDGLNGPRYVSHFSTCPHAQVFRSKGKDA